MSKGLVFLLLAASVFVTGCNNAAINTHSEYPRGEASPTVYQKKMQAANHWNELAKIEAKNVLCRLPKSSKPIYIKRSPIVQGGSDASYIVLPSPFQKAFGDLITSHLVRQGVVDVELQETKNSIKIDYDVQILTHNDRGYLRPKFGTYALIAANMAMLYDASHWGTPGLVGIPIVAQLEWFNSTKETGASPVEVIITTRAVENNKIIMSDSRIYYINSGDKSHYKHYKQEDNRQFKVVSE